MKTMMINTGWGPQHKEQQENGSKLPPLSAKVFLDCIVAIGCSVDDNESTVGEEEAWPGLPEPRKIHMVLFLQTLTSSRPYFDIIRLHSPPASWQAQVEGDRTMYLVLLQMNEIPLLLLSVI